MRGGSRGNHRLRQFIKVKSNFLTDIHANNQLQYSYALFVRFYKINELHNIIQQSKQTKLSLKKKKKICFHNQ